MNVAIPPGLTSAAAGLATIVKLGVVGSTVIVRVGGCGSELPLESPTVSEAVYTPALGKVTLPGFCAVDLDGVPPGKIHAYFGAVVLVPKETVPPADIVTLEVLGEVMVLVGGAVE